MSELDDVFAYNAPMDPITIQKVIPHRYPFMLVDGITELGADYVKGFKNLSYSESVFQGHFPGEPVFPGVLQIELIAQVGACWILSRKENLGKIAYLMTVEAAKFRRPARPGMRLDVHGVITSYKRRVGKLEGIIRCEGEVISSANVLFAFQKEDNGSGTAD